MPFLAIAYSLYFCAFSQVLAVLLLIHHIFSYKLLLFCLNHFVFFAIKPSLFHAKLLYFQQNFGLILDLQALCLAVGAFSQTLFAALLNYPELVE